MFSSLYSSSQDGIIGKIDYSDSILGKIDSITTFIHHPDSKFGYATDYDPTMPEGMYAIYLADTIKGELRYATAYSYTGKIKKLTNYYFFEKKLIKVTEYRVPMKNQESRKLEKFTRTYYYYNDSLRFYRNGTGENVNNKSDLIVAAQILKRFESKYSSGQLEFKSP